MRYDVAVVGGGIVGLAVLRELGRRYPHARVCSVEKEPGLGAHQTGRNSGVVHSGIYYAPGSLKARLCVAGRERTYAYCDRAGIPYRKVGKLIVATEPHELGRLDDLWERGRRNGVTGLERLDARGIREREPHATGIAAISSAQTGIVDWSLVATSFANDARRAGADFFLGHRVERIDRRADGVVLRTPRGEIEARYVVACAGLHADRVARLTGGPADPRIVPFRGDYLVLRRERAGLVRGNIYPVPDPAFPFLGVHFTPRMDGAVWLGPNAVLAFAREGYALADVRPRDLWETLSYPGFRKLAATYWRVGAGEMYRDVVRAAYVRALQRYVPELRPEDCVAGPAGVRAQALAPDGSLVDDFAFDDAERVVHVRNAPSPAATSSLAIADYVADHVAARFELGRAVA